MRHWIAQGRDHRLFFCIILATNPLARGFTFSTKEGVRPDVPTLCV
nr:hypothetical protein JVH1_9271 [Rhodococcus sp. JVH1]